MRAVSRYFLLSLLLVVFVLVTSGVLVAQDEKVVTVGLVSEPPTLDIRNYALTPSTFAIVWQIHEPLVYHDTRTDELIPGLAESWEQLDEDSYQFNLRQGVTWHDGEEFNADDVVWTFTRTSYRLAQFGLNPENAVEVIDPHTIIVNTNGPQGPFLKQNLALNMYILPEHILEPLYTEARAATYEETTDEEGNTVSPEENLQAALNSIDRGDNWQEPSAIVGTGPFALESWERGNQVVLAANENYWGGRPNIDQLVFRFVEDATSRVIGLESGDFDLILDVPEAEVSRLQGVEDVEVIVSPGLGYRMLTMNQAVPALSDVRVRQAIAYAIDKDEIVSLYGDLATRTCGPLSVNSGFYNDQVNCFDYDPDAAMALLEEAGWDPSTALTLTVTSTSADEALLIQQYLGDVGITVNINEVDEATHRTTVRGGESELAIQSFGNVVDPDHIYWVFTTTPGLGGPIFSYENATVNQLLADGQKSSVDADRMPIYTEAQRIIVDEDTVAVFLYSSADVRAFRSDRLAGIQAMARPTDVFYWLRSAEVVE